MEKVFCNNCEFYKEYFDEWGDICISNPKKHRNYHSKYNEYDNPAAKNKRNYCKEWKKRKEPKTFWNKIRKEIKKFSVSWIEASDDYAK